MQFQNLWALCIKNPTYPHSLLLIPALIIFGLLYNNLDGNFDQLNEGVVKFARLFPHGVLDAFFIGGNILIFAFAAIGLSRFWKNLNSITSADKKKGFIKVLIETIIEIVSHKNFNTCSNSSTRFWGHLLIFYGFFGAMATAGLAVGALVLFDLTPIPLFHPIKIFGNLSGLVW